MSSDAFKTFNTFKPSLMSGVILEDTGQEITLKSSIAGNFIVKKEKIKEIEISSGTGFLGGNKAIIIINGEQGELVRSGNLKFDHAKSIKDWIESRLAPINQNGSSNASNATSKLVYTQIPPQEKVELHQSIDHKQGQQPVDSHNNAHIELDTKFYYKSWFIALMVIIFFPVGLFLLWRSNTSKKIKWATTLFFIAIVIYSGNRPATAPEQSTSSQSGVVNDTTYTALVPADQLAKQKSDAERHKANKEKAKAEVVKILNSMSSHTDQVEKVTWYTPWSGENYPAESAIYWYAAKKDNRVWMRAKVVHYSSSINWVFWDKAIFSTPEKNWTYQMKNVFAGQSGGGKSTQIVMGGKYETLDVNFEELQPGYQLLANSKGANVIRLEGKEYKFDYKPNSTDLSHIKTGLYLYEQLNLIGNTLE